MGKKKNIECIEDALQAILDAQNKAQNKNKCHNQTYNYFLDELKKGSSTMANTVPFILYNGDKPFKATGFKRHNRSNANSLVCVNTFIFKIISLEKNCAVLELLEFKQFPGMKPTVVPTASFDKCPSPCFQGEGESLDDLVSTGVCITVDPACFCGITCLPPVYI
jgi:hypothetical protein